MYQVTRHNRIQSRAFSLVEILVVVAIVSILVGVTVVGVGEWTAESEQRQTDAVMLGLEAALDEYRNEVGQYPNIDPALGVASGMRAEERMDLFLEEVQNVGEIFKTLGAYIEYIDSDGDGTPDRYVALDGWGKVIGYVSPNTNVGGTTRPVTDRRPYFISSGPDLLQNDDNDFSNDASDDISSNVDKPAHKEGDNWSDDPHS